jgi:hypothetical protein
VSGAEIADAFWRGFQASLSPETLEHFGTLKVRLGSPNYRGFERRLPLGFKPVAVVLTRDDQLRAELTSDRPDGVALVRQIAQAGGTITHGGSPCEARVSDGQDGFGRLALLWNAAGVRNPTLWPAHHLWLLCALQDLTDTFEPLLDDHATGRPSHA